MEPASSLQSWTSHVPPTPTKYCLLAQKHDSKYHRLHVCVAHCDSSVVWCISRGGKYTTLTSCSDHMCSILFAYPQKQEERGRTVKSISFPSSLKKTFRSLWPGFLKHTGMHNSKRIRGVLFLWDIPWYICYDPRVINPGSSSGEAVSWVLFS